VVDESTGNVFEDANKDLFLRGGIYISNNTIKNVLIACALNPIPAVLIGIGIYKVCAILASAGAKIGAAIGGIAGPIGSIIGALLGIAGFGALAYPFVDAVIQGKGVNIGLKYTWFGMPYGLDISVR